MGEKQFVGVYLDNDLYDRLHFACQRRGITKSEALRQAIELWLKQGKGEEGKEEPGSERRGFTITWA